MGAVKKSGKNSNQCGIGRSKIDRTGNYKTVCFFKFRRQFIYDVIKNTFSKLVAALTGNAAVLLVEQNAKKALSIADRAYVLETGSITMDGKAEDLLNDEAVQKAYLGE